MDRARNLRQNHRHHETDEGEDQFNKIREGERPLKKKYQGPDKEVEKMTKGDNKDNVENLADEAEEAVSMALRGGYSNANKPDKDENDRILSRVQFNLKRWQEHLYSILNQPDPGDRYSQRASSLPKREILECPHLYSHVDL